METFKEEWVTDYHVFENGFECCLDIDGIIWIKEGNENVTEWERPCMKLCYDLIMIQDKVIGKGILAKACEIQNCEGITERATRYKS